MTWRMLHIYNTCFEHDDALILGNRLALSALRDAIEEALRNGKACIEAMAADGEGFSAYVVLRDGQFQEWKKVALPYTDMASQDTREGIEWLFDIIGPDLLLLPEPRSAWVEEL